MINLNTAPYYDDFDGDKNFHQVLFKPGYAVQARELTQLQSILQDQVAKFGNHIFKHGSIVIPGNSISDLAVPYVKITSLVNIDLFVGKTIVGSLSGIEAIVKKSVPVNLTEPAMFFLTYMSGNSTTGEITFRAAEELYIKDSVNVRCTTTAAPTGVGSLVYVNRGVYYINGKFVLVLPQSIVISKYTSTPSCHVFLKITEEIVNSDTDTTLLDPAQGSNNFAAPGADRSKVSLELISLPLSSVMTDDYVEIMRYNEGVLEEHSRNPKYSELEKSLARRTFDESGNYIVTGLNPVIRDHLKIDSNNGVYPNGDLTKLVVDISSGKAYIDGFEVDKIASTKITIDKARTQQHIKTAEIIIRPEFGQYLIVSNIVGNFSVKTRELVTLYNTSDSTDVSASIIGTAKVIGVDLLSGDVGVGAIYKLWITNLTIIPNKLLDNVGGIRFGVNKSAFVLHQYSTPITGGGFVAGEMVTHVSGRTARVKYFDPSTSTLYVYKNSTTLSAPRVGELIIGATSNTASTILSLKLLVSTGKSGAIFPLVNKAIKTFINPVTQNYSLQYYVQKELIILTNSSGNGSVSVNSGEIILPIELGTFVAIDSVGVVPNTLFSLNNNGDTVTLTGGTASTTVRLYANVLKTNISPKSKTLVTRSQVFSSPTSAITLDRTDIVKLVSVIDAIGDKTINYNLFNGQDDNSYMLGRIVLDVGKSSPVGAITVTYSYYEHSISGDFFCIDSYPANILDTYNNYSSASTGVVYDLSSAIDFRPSVGTNGEFSGTNSRTNDLIISGTTFNTTIQFFVPRIDIITVSPTGKMNVIAGIPSTKPITPGLPIGQMLLNRIYISEYTKTSADTINTRIGVEGYTMKDISSISKRVERVENFASLTASELRVTSVDVVDAATGLNKFKTGYLVENFNTPLSIARTTSGDYAATFVGTTLHPQMENMNCGIVVMNTSIDFAVKSNYLMMPFTEVVFASQNLSSRVTNLNPFLVVKWDGILSILPPSDSWVEIRDLATIFENKTEESIVTVYIPCPVYYPPPVYEQPAYYPPTANESPVTSPDSWIPAPFPTPWIPAVPSLPANTYGGYFNQYASYFGVDEFVVNTLATAFAASPEYQVMFLDGNREFYDTNIGNNYNGDSPVLISETTYGYDNSNRVVATTSGFNVNGTAFTSSKVI
jgi:hypothetical protein